MTFEDARRLTEILLAVAVGQQALEHLAGPDPYRWRFAAQVVLALAVVAGIWPIATLGLLLLLGLDALRHFHGPYNGGSDRMRLLVLGCLVLSHVAPTAAWARVALGYLAVQVVLSYALAGWVKLANPGWRNGQALTDVFAFSVYPVSERLRAWADAPRTMRGLGWVTVAFEILFPLALLDATLLRLALGMALIFHLGNAFVFGLNRFVWVWVAGYPSLLWFQQALVTGMP
ncbi:MAG: HTTM domain-containing protein [Acidobacteria bacterium]|nr:HTTM domain-containing protein [Acidobacteriota bacterium]